MRRIIQLCLAGGLGTRLGHLSPANHPKQFLTLHDGQSLFQQTLQRNAPLCDAQIVLTQTHLVDLALLQSQRAQNLKPLNWVKEPSGKNTAASVLLGAFAAVEQATDATLLITPADHWIEDDAAYRRDITQALVLAEQGLWVLLGISPTHASSEFGYLKSTANGVTFIEKPHLALAQQLLTDDNIFWNSGILVCPAQALMDTFKTLVPEVFEPISLAYQNRQTDELSKSDFERCSNISLDFALLQPLSQQSNPLHLLKAGFDWQDLGSIETLTPYLKNELEPVERVWGNYRVLEHRPGFYKVKHLEVLPHKSLSLQRHQFRSEHWTVIQGIATVVLNDKELTLQPHDSLQIPLGALHKLQNQQDTPLIILEIQVGQLTEEDDIIRFEPF